MENEQPKEAPPTSQNQELPQDENPLSVPDTKRKDVKVKREKKALQSKRKEK